MKTRSNRLYIDPETKKYYHDIKMNYSSLKLRNSDVFSLALAMGYYCGVKKPLDRKIAYIRFETITLELLAMIDLLTLYEFGDSNQELFDNPILGFDLAEEYANAGIKILVEKIYNSNEDIDSFLYNTIFELYEDIDFKKVD